VNSLREARNKLKILRKKPLGRRTLCILKIRLKKDIKIDDMEVSCVDGTVESCAVSSVGTRSSVATVLVI
jgi:hypothetical protein